MHRTLVTPSADAASRSPLSAMRLRSRPVICIIGSTSRSISSRAAATGDIAIFAPAESVRLKASTTPRSDSARRNSGRRSAPFGGFQFGGHREPAGCEGVSELLQRKTPVGGRWSFRAPQGTPLRVASMPAFSVSSTIYPKLAFV